MSADIKWETVEWGYLKAGDKIRLTTRNGDIVHGEFVDEPHARYIDTDFIDVWHVAATKCRIERAVPERTLSTEPGIYVDAGIWRDSPTDAAVFILKHGTWSHSDWRPANPALNLNLVRLVPVTEVDELRKRIAQADEYLAAQHRETEIGDIRPSLTSILYGEATDV